MLKIRESARWGFENEKLGFHWIDVRAKSRRTYLFKNIYCFYNFRDETRRFECTPILLKYNDKVLYDIYSDRTEHSI